MGFNTFVSVLRVTADLLPVAYDLVKSLDGIAEQEGTGPEKLQIVMDLLKEAVAEAKATGVTWEKVEPVLRRVVEGMLALVRR